MPIRHVTWDCMKCRKRHFSYEEARACETGHIVDEAVARTRQAIAEVFSGSTVRAARKPQPSQGAQS